MAATSRRIGSSAWRALMSGVRRRRRARRAWWSTMLRISATRRPAGPGQGRAVVGKPPRPRSGKSSSGGSCREFALALGGEGLEAPAVSKACVQTPLRYWGVALGARVEDLVGRGASRTQGSGRPRGSRGAGRPPGRDPPELHEAASVANQWKAWPTQTTSKAPSSKPWPSASAPSTTLTPATVRRNSSRIAATGSTATRSAPKSRPPRQDARTGGDLQDPRPGRVRVAKACATPRAG